MVATIMVQLLAVGGFARSTLHCTGWAAAAAEDQDAAAAAEGAAEVEGEEEEGENYGLADAQQSAAHAAGRAKGTLVLPLLLLTRCS